MATAVYTNKNRIVTQCFNPYLSLLHLTRLFTVTKTAHDLLECPNGNMWRNKLAYSPHYKIHKG